LIAQVWVLADRYTQLFEGKWLTPGEAKQDEASVLGTSDIQSLADLGNSFELARTMRVFPVEPSDFVALAIPAVIPALPLLTTVMSLSEIGKDLLKLIA
jgi:hypothetical protein